MNLRDPDEMRGSAGKLGSRLNLNFSHTTHSLSTNDEVSYSLFNCSRGAVILIINAIAFIVLHIIAREGIGRARIFYILKKESKNGWSNEGCPASKSDRFVVPYKRKISSPGFSCHLHLDPWTQRNSWKSSSQRYASQRHASQAHLSLRS